MFEQTCKFRKHYKKRTENVFVIQKLKKASFLSKNLTSLQNIYNLFHCTAKIAKKCNDIYISGFGNL